MKNTYDALSELKLKGKTYQFYDIKKVPHSDRLPYSLKILLENLLRNEETVGSEDIRFLGEWTPHQQQAKEISYRPARVLLQDFTGVPAIVDLAAMRDAILAMKGNPNAINPQQPVELVVDHSVQVDKYATPDALMLNTKLEYMRNRERYQFLKWGQKVFNNFKVVPPGSGIVHQVNLEYLARVAFVDHNGNPPLVYPDTLVGTDSHTPMVNGLGVLAWGVGGIEAEAAMLGQPISMLLPQVVGFHLEGRLPEGATATDLVLTVAEILRKHGVVGKFVEFYGEGLKDLPVADRATIGNMSPEYGATCAIFPVDELTLKYMTLSDRPEESIALTEAYFKEQGMFGSKEQVEYNSVVSLNLAEVQPSIAGPKRPQDRVPLRKSKEMFTTALAKKEQDIRTAEVKSAKGDFILKEGAVVIAAITSCTNTSNPSVMLGAGLIAKNAVARGLKPQPWVKTSLAPGSRVVTEYLKESGLDKYLDTLGFNLVGYGCTTCIGNSGPLLPAISAAIRENDLSVCAVLSGNRNFEGRVHPEVKMNYLASPLLVVVYALAGRMDIDLYNQPLGKDKEGKDVYMVDIWPSNEEIADAVQKYVSRDEFSRTYETIFDGEENWEQLEVKDNKQYDWVEDSTYVRPPPFFTDLAKGNDEIEEITKGRVLVLLGDSVTTDHISPAGAIKEDSPAGVYLKSQGVPVEEFNSYGSRRGNHEVMMRGTFANIRLRNLLVPETEGGVTVYKGEQMSIYDAAMKYLQDETPCLIIAGKEYGSGSSRDWAAKGPLLLGVKAVIAESFERIHRTNLVGMGILPLQFKSGENAKVLGLTGAETYDIKGINGGSAREVQVFAYGEDGKKTDFLAEVRIDTPQEIEYYKSGGILQYVLKQLAA